MPAPILRNITNDDLSARFQYTTTVGGSPSDDAETIIGTLTIPDFGNLTVTSGIKLAGWAAYTVGTNGVSVNLRIRETDVTGTVVAATGATTATADDLGSLSALGVSAAPGVAVYVLTMEVASGSADSTVSALTLAATVV